MRHGTSTWQTRSARFCLRSVCSEGVLLHLVGKTATCRGIGRRGNASWRPRRFPARGGLKAMKTGFSKYAGLAVGICALFFLEAQGAGSPTPVLKGSEACTSCHVAYQDHKAYIYHRDCLSCHASATERHLVEGGPGVGFPDSGDCLKCHESRNLTYSNWAFSDHGKAQIDCRACHGIHRPGASQPSNRAYWKTDEHSKVCFDCHLDVAARMNMASHHPVKEGALSCVSCHDPHSSEKLGLLQRNERCFECHQAVRGPKIFEHAPVAEDCMICHNPHGSPNAGLLEISQPIQCLQCHPLAVVHRQGGSGRLTGGQLRYCTACHAAVHGSHVDAKLRR